MSLAGCIKHLCFTCFFHGVNAGLTPWLFLLCLDRVIYSVSLCDIHRERNKKQKQNLTSLLLFALLCVGTERSESTRFPGQHMFDHQSSNPLNNNHNLHHQQQQQMPNQGHMGFGPPGPPFNQLGQGPIGLFPREPPRPNLPPHQGHQGMMNLNQGASPNQPRPFMAPRQHFGQQGSPFPPPVQFGMQVRLRVSGFF